MVVRIRFPKGPKLGQKRRRNRRAAVALASLLTPAALIAVLLACWRIAADLSLTNRFAIPSGLFSHWQIWLAAAVLLEVCARVLNRYGKGRDPAVS